MPAAVCAKFDMYYQKLTKFEIAEQQLFQAVELYLAGNHLVSAVTLAGAAEEILGELVRRRGGKTALDEKVEVLCKMFEFAFKKSANPKDFINLRNNARNELKHIRTADFIELDLEEEAVKLLDRAISNYKKLKPGPTKKCNEFKNERVRRYRQRVNEIEKI